MKRYLTLRELAGELNIPKSTVVKYKDFFSEFLPMYGEGKRKKFEQSAIEVLSLVRKLREEDKRDWMEIREALTERFGSTSLGEAPGVDSDETAVVPAGRDTAVLSLEKRVDHIAHILTTLAGEIVRMRDSLGDVEARVRTFNGAGNRLEQLEKDAESIQKELGRAADRIGTVQRTVEQTDAKNKKRFEFVLAKMRQDMNLLGHVVTDSDQTRAIVKKVEKWMEDHAALQTRYMMLIQENDRLKEQLRTRRSAETESPGVDRSGRGLFGRFRPEAGRK